LSQAFLLESLERVQLDFNQVGYVEDVG